MSDITDHSQMTAAEKETYHRAAEGKLQTFRYARPQPVGVKDFMLLFKSEKVTVSVHVVRDGGENNLHYHTNMDQVYFVLSGRVRFYGPGDVLIEELGPQQGIFVPEGSRYWFEKCGPEDLEVFQIMMKSGKAKRINIEPHKAWMNTFVTDGMEKDHLRVYEEPPTN
jgi:mannose-6-phosphate isomerase-like protein (cupin superfamily)